MKERIEMNEAEFFAYFISLMIGIGTSVTDTFLETKVTEALILSIASYFFITLG